MRGNAQPAVALHEVAAGASGVTSRRQLGGPAAGRQANRRTSRGFHSPHRLPPFLLRVPGLVRASSAYRVQHSSGTNSASPLSLRHVHQSIPSRPGLRCRLRDRGWRAQFAFGRRFRCHSLAGRAWRPLAASEMALVDSQGSCRRAGVHPAAGRAAVPWLRGRAAAKTYPHLRRGEERCRPLLRRCGFIAEVPLRPDRSIGPRWPPPRTLPARIESAPRLPRCRSVNGESAGDRADEVSRRLRAPRCTIERAAPGPARKPKFAEEYVPE